MSTLPTSPSKPPPKPPEGRPETQQYELEKRESDVAAAKEASKSEWARVTPRSSPPPPPTPPPADPDKWGTATLVGQQAPIVADAPRARSEATSKTASTQRGQDVSETIHRGATQLAGALGTGFRAASRSLAESSPGALEALLPGAMPSLDLLGADPIAALSTRLAAESDFWRRLALRSLSRAVIADRVSYFVAGLGVIGGLAISVVAGLGGLFAGEHALARAAVLAVGALGVLCAGGVAFAFTHAIRRAQRATADGAFMRADNAELRLHRLAIAIALRGGDAVAFREALKRVTDDGSR